MKDKGEDKGKEGKKLRGARETTERETERSHIHCKTEDCPSLNTAVW